MNMFAINMYAKHIEFYFMNSIYLKYISKINIKI